MMITCVLSGGDHVSENKCTMRTVSTQCEIMVSLGMTSVVGLGYGSFYAKNARDTSVSLV
jgi:hypothetical protein